MRQAVKATREQGAQKKTQGTKTQTTHNTTKHMQEDRAHRRQTSKRYAHAHVHAAASTARYVTKECHRLKGHKRSTNAPANQVNNAKAKLPPYIP